MTDPKVYLGDGAYAEWDGYNVILTTENGIAVTNTVVLEPEVFRALVKARQEWTRSEERKP